MYRHVRLQKGMKRIYKSAILDFHLAFGQLSHSSAKLVAQKVITSEQKKQHDHRFTPLSKKTCQRCHGTIGNLYNRYTGIHWFDK